MSSRETDDGTPLPARAQRRGSLDFIFAPRSVAVIGATARAGSVGAALLANLRSFKRPVFAVNPKHTSISGVPAFPKIGDVPERIDLAVIVTPAHTVPGIVRECVDAGVGGAIVISAGFKETGPAGARLEHEILDEARRGPMRVVGPNCLGVMMPHLALNASFAATSPLPGNVAFVSQSGALCTAILDWSMRERVGFSAFVSMGSMLDVGWGDLIYHLGDDPHTRSILCYMEAVGDARSFLSAAREVAYFKPIVVVKVGRSDAAARAAASHTGALTGSDEVLDAAFRRVGVLRVNAVEELFDMAEVLGKQPRPRGPRLAIVTNAGGPGALATDMLMSAGGTLAELSEPTRTGLDALLPPHWSHGNPVDVLGDADAERYARAVDLVAKDPNSDGTLVILTPQAMTDATATAARIVESSKGAGKPLLANWMGGPAVDAGESILNAARVPTFKYPERAVNAFAYMWRYSSNLAALYETPALLADSVDRAAMRDAARVMIQGARSRGCRLLTEAESKEILSAYGIPVLETRVAREPEQAVAHAQDLGYPVAIKLLSATLTHKTDVGGVRLDVRDASAVRAAWQAIEMSVSEKAGAEHFGGVTVQRMAPAQGYELIVGSSVDTQFGPVMLFGAGGQLVEVLKDRALGLPPLNATLARRLIEQTRVYTALKGVRGRPPVDFAALERTLVAFSNLVVEQPWIAEIEINPLLASAEGVVALDARVILHDAATPEDAIPRPAIRPYPVQYVRPWKLKDGTPVTIRPIRPEDEPWMVAFHEGLSPRSVYFRYFTAAQLRQRVAHERLSRLCFVDYDREIALVVENGKQILGVGRLVKLHGVNEAEFALIVSDGWQRQGLGTRLLEMLVEIGRDEKLEAIRGTILAENREMQQVAQKLGFEIHSEAGDTECQARIPLKDVTPGALFHVRPLTSPAS